MFLELFRLDDYVYVLYNNKNKKIHILEFDEWKKDKIKK